MRLSALTLTLPLLAASRLAAAEPPSSPVPAEPVHAVASPCVGAGYLPYSYPGVDTCPCVGDGCFPPARYYCGGEAYRRHWLRKWLGAHFCGRSMLDDYPCQCIYPMTGRIWLPAAERP